MSRKFTFWLTLFGIAVCLLNYLGYDPDSLLLYFTSIPVWFIEIIRDIHGMNMFVVYLVTVLSWTAIGIFLDEMVERRRARNNRQ